jgi:hypothetical protein
MRFRNVYNHLVFQMGVSVLTLLCTALGNGAVVAAQYARARPPPPQEKTVT